MNKYIATIAGSIILNDKEKLSIAKQILHFLGYKDAEQNQDLVDHYQFFKQQTVTKRQFEVLEKKEKELIYELLERNDIDPIHLIFSIVVDDKEI